MTFTSLSAFGLNIAAKATLLGEPFTLRGRTETGIIDDTVTSEMFAVGGSILSQPISVTLKKKTFTPALNTGEKVTARSVNYTVRQISADEVSITLICDRENKR